jgi:hypothetical protein
MSKIKVFKLEVLIFDFDGIGKQEVISVLEDTNYPNHCISPQIKKVEVREVEWSEDHPLNKRDTSEQAYKDLFKE